MKPDIQLLDFRDEEVMKFFIEVITKHCLILLTPASEPVGHEYSGKEGCYPRYALSLHYQLSPFSRSLRLLGWWLTLLCFNA